MARTKEQLRKAWQEVKDHPAAASKFLRREANFQKALHGPYSMYYADRNPERWPDRYGILPFGKDQGKWSPYATQEHPFGKEWLADSVVLMCRRMDQPRTYPTRIIHSHGVPPRVDDRIGVEFRAMHDQTGAKLGVYRIVGIVVYDPTGDVGRVEGDVPLRKLYMSTYK